MLAHGGMTVVCMAKCRSRELPADSQDILQQTAAISRQMHVNLAFRSALGYAHGCDSNIFPAIRNAVIHRLHRIYLPKFPV